MSNNKNFTESEIIKQINLIHNLYIESRAAFPYYPLDEQPPLISGSKTSFVIITPRPMTIEDKQYRNNIAHFQNQNFLVRLFAVLQYYEIFKNPDETLPGYIELDILKRLRNEFSHGIGTYNPKSSKDRKLMKDITKHFSFKEKEYPDFSINKDIVIKGIISESKKYIKELFNKPKPKPPSYLKFFYLYIKNLLICFKRVYARLKEQFP